MIHYVRICGPAGWGLLFVSMVVTIMIVHMIISIIRNRTEQRVTLQHRLAATVFWGFMGAVLGFLGQTSAIHNAMTVIIPAKSISPEMIDRGFRESFLPSFWGFGILLATFVFYLSFRLILRHGSVNRSAGPSGKKPGLGTAVCVFMLLSILSIPAHSSAGLDPEVPDALISNVWVGRAAPDDIVFRVWTGVDGALTGEAHTLRGGKHMTQSPATRVIWNDPDLELVMNTGVIFRGTFDATNNRIDGRLEYKGEKLMDLPLSGSDPDMIKGLVARPIPTRGEPLYSYSVPSETGDGWQVAGPEVTGLEQAALEAFVADIIRGKAGLLHSVLIASKGKLILEEYFHGYERDDLHRLASVTKSVSSLITGIAIDRGEIQGVETPLMNFFPQCEDLFTDEWEEVTLKHLLTMSVGTAWTEEEASRTHGAGDEFFRMLFSRSFAWKPGEKWQYVSANVNLLGGVIKHATGMHADQFADIHLFQPLDIREWNWDYGTVDGYRLMDGSLMLRPRDMAKLGSLVADGGNWNGKRIISEEWIRESTAPQIVPSEDGPEKYGDLWWLFYIPSNAGILESVVANGKGSQLISVFPALDLIMVTTGSNDENQMQFAVGRLLSIHILNGISAAE